MGDVLIIDKVNDKPGESIQLQPLLLVDGSTVTSDVGPRRASGSSVPEHVASAASTADTASHLTAPSSHRGG